MTEKLVFIEEQTIVKGFRIRTNNENESNPETAKIMSLWEKFLQSPLPTYVNSGEYFYGVYSQYESDHSEDYTLTVGIDSKSISVQSEEYQKIIVQSGKYMLFEANGKQPESIITTWQYIWKYFSDDSAPKRKFTTDFEKYISDSKVEIYIAVEN